MKKHGRKEATMEMKIKINEDGSGTENKDENGGEWEIRKMGDKKTCEKSGKHENLRLKPYLRELKHISNMTLSSQCDRVPGIRFLE